MLPNSTFWIINSRSSIAEVLLRASLVSIAGSFIAPPAQCVVRGGSAGARSWPVALVHSLFANRRLERAESLDYVPLLGHRASRERARNLVFRYPCEPGAIPDKRRLLSGSKHLASIR